MDNNIIFSILLILIGIFLGIITLVIINYIKGNSASKKAEKLLEKAKNIDAKEVKENIEAKIFEIKTELEDLDKEKVKKIAEKKVEQLKKKKIFAYIVSGIGLISGIITIITAAISLSS